MQAIVLVIPVLVTYHCILAILIPGQSVDIDAMSNKVASSLFYKEWEEQGQHSWKGRAVGHGEHIGVTSSNPAIIDDRPFVFTRKCQPDPVA